MRVVPGAPLSQSARELDLLVQGVRASLSTRLRDDIRTT